MFSLFIMLNEWIEDDHFLSIIKGLINATIIDVALCLVGYLGFNNLLYGHVRAKGFFKDPNVNCSFLLVALGYTILYKGIKRNKKYIILPSIMLVILLTFSRATYISVFLYLVTLIFFYRRKRKEIVNIIIISLILAVCFFSLFSLWPVFLSRLRIQKYDYNLRFKTWEKAKRELIGNITSPEKTVLGFFIGYGPGSFDILYGHSAHNTYLRFLVEHGLLGSIIFLYLLYKKISFSSLLKNTWILFLNISLAVNILFIDALHWRHMWIHISSFLYVKYVSRYYEYNNGV